MKNLTLKNFRVFDANGSTFDLSPLTVLTGCNSSGKSSVTKCCMLIQKLMQCIAKDIAKGEFKSLDDYYINFTMGNHKLGSFESIVNWQSKEKYFDVEYDAEIYSVGAPFHVSITFEPCKSVFQKSFSNESIFFAHNGKSNCSPANTKFGQSLFAKIVKLKISNCEAGTFFEYAKNAPDNLQSLLHLTKEYKEILIGMSLSLDAKVAIDDIRNCMIASEIGAYNPSEYQDGDLEGLMDFYGSDYANSIFAFWEESSNKCPKQYEELAKVHKMKPVRGEDGTIDWTSTDNSFNFKYDLLRPLTFMSELDEISKEEVMNWVQTNILDKSRNRWFYCEKFKDRIIFIFNRFINSEFHKFSDFYAYYENELFKNYHIDFASGRGDNRMIEGAFFGTACKERPKPWFDHNLYEDDWNWDNISDSAFYVEMFNCLSGFGGYCDESMIGVPDGGISFREQDIIMRLAEYVCMEALCSAQEVCNAQFVEIDRSNTQRIYTFSAQGTSFNDTLTTYLHLPENVYKGSDEGLINLSRNTYKRGSFINKWLKELTDYEEALFELTPEGVGMSVYLRKKVNGKSRIVSLADVGYGTTPLISLLIRIELMICEYFPKENQYCTMFVEEPESNLHPNLQSKLALMLTEAITKYPMRFVLETHSEYLIRKIQTLVARHELESDDVVIYYLSNPDPKRREDNEPQVKQIKIKENGGLTAKFGKGFLDESTILSAELFR